MNNACGSSSIGNVDILGRGEERRSREKGSCLPIIQDIMPLSSAQGNYFPKMIEGLASFEVQSRDFSAQKTQK